MMLPTYAIIAVTLNCNSRCIMCNIWQNKIPNELTASEYLKLPSSLKDINITGGEPFLRRDIVEIVRNMKTAAPKARLVLNTNGFMPHKIKTDMEQIFRIDPKFAFRVSIDGMGDMHDKIRGIPGGFKKIIATLESVKKIGITDIGVSFTLIKQNMDEVKNVQEFCKTNKYEFSLTVATSSTIYFGKDKQSYRPVADPRLHSTLNMAAKYHLTSFTPKEIIRGWFTKKLYEYIKTGKRGLKCDAGTGFFYMDSIGNIYTCHLKPWKIGNIKTQSLDKIFSDHKYAKQVSTCNDCFMICTTKSMIKNHKIKVGFEALKYKFSA